MRDPKDLRVFFALWPGDAIRERLQQTALLLAVERPARRVPAYNLHLTLQFIGNIYADEVLWRARIRSDRPAGSLDGAEVKELRRHVRPVLSAGLAAGGTSLDDLGYLLPDGRAGEYISRLRAYGREDEPCRRCGTPIARIVLRGRSTFFCPTCQT